MKIKLNEDLFFTLIVIALLFIPVLIDSSYFIHIFILAMLYGALALSWNLTMGYAGVFTFGHQAFFGLGAYFSALLGIYFGVSPWLSMVLAGLVAGISGLIIGIPCLKMRAAPYISIATLAFAEVTRIVATNWVGVTRGELGLWGISPITPLELPLVGTIRFDMVSRISNYYLMLIIFVIVFLVVRSIVKSNTGLAFKAMRESQDAAESLGVNLTKYKLLAYLLGAVIAGYLGAFYAHYVLILTPNAVIGKPMMLEIMVMTILGGTGTLCGPIVGSFLLILGLESLRGLELYRFVVYAGLIIIFIMFIPEGIVPTVTKRGKRFAEWAASKAAEKRDSGKI